MSELKKSFLKTLVRRSWEINLQLFRKDAERGTIMEVFDNKIYHVKFYLLGYNAV
jgi:hypothetical protein